MIEGFSRKYLLDADIIIASLRGEGFARARLADAEPRTLAISTVTEAELLFGVEKRRRQDRPPDWTSELIARFTILPWTSEAAAVYARLRADLEAVGKALARMDLLVAAHAVATGATLVSRDGAFRRVPGLQLENWLVPS